MKRYKILIAGLAMLSALLVGCSAGEQSTPTPTPALEFASLIAITGEVLPARRATVSPQRSGAVAAVEVEPGDVVAAGDLLVQLDPTDAQLAVRRAEAALDGAQERLGQIQAEPLQARRSEAEAELDAAEAALSQAAARLDQLQAGAVETEIATARVRVREAEIDRFAAYHEHKDTMECRKITLPDGSERKICPLLGPPEERARYALQAADEQLDAAHARLTALNRGSDERLQGAEASVIETAARRDAAQARLNVVESGATEEEIAVRETEVDAARVALESARLTLTRTQVRVPITGTIGRVNVSEGELAAPGQPIVEIGDLDTLRVETTDLGELDVALVQIGQGVTITFDALPDAVSSGRVTRIAPKADSEAGGVAYTTIIELDEIHPQLRWGMTAFVDIEIQQEE